MLSVAWGRLEGHVIGNLLTAISLLGTAPRNGLPMRWDDRLDLWKKVFSVVPILQPHKDRAVLFMKSIIEAANDRNFAAHTVWDEFVPDAEEPTIAARAIRHRKGSPNEEIEVVDARITLSMVKRALTDCNRLNLELSEFSKLFEFLRPSPADARHV
jgi:hypothetical protein